MVVAVAMAVMKMVSEASVFGDGEDDEAVDEGTEDEVVCDDGRDAIDDEESGGDDDDWRTCMGAGIRSETFAPDVSSGRRASRRLCFPSQPSSGCSSGSSRKQRLTSERSKENASSSFFMPSMLDLWVLEKLWVSSKPEKVITMQVDHGVVTSLLM